MGLYDKTLGVLMVGIFFNTYLYGLVTYQFATYYRTNFNDRPITKYMVLFLFILDTLHSVSVIYVAWHYAVENFDNPAVLSLIFWPFIFTPLCTALSAFVTHLFLGFSIWRLTNSKILYGVAVALAVPSFMLGLTCVVVAICVKSESEISHLAAIELTWMILQVIVDGYITTTLAIAYSRLRTGFYSTDSMLHRLIRGAVQTGLFAGIFSIACFVSNLVSPDTYFFIMFSIPVGRIYTNTLMDILLTRESIKSEIAEKHGMDSPGDPLTSRIVLQLEASTS